MSALFLELLYSQVLKSFFEKDLLWLIPSVFRTTKGLSLGQLIIYFLDPLPVWHAMPPVKIYAFFILSFLGPLAKHFIFTSILVHFFNSILLFLVSKKLGLNTRIGFLSALTYLTLFAHFHAYIWPMAFQHIIVVFFILLGLNYYLKTDKLINNGEKFHLLYILTLLINLVASFCRPSVLILPGMIITHILFCSKNNKDRLRKYDIWMPSFILYLFYPLMLIVVTDLRVKRLLFMLSSLVSDNVSFDMFINRSNIPIKLSIAFLLGLSCLFIFRAILVMYQKYNLKKVLKWTSIITAMVTFLLLIILGGPKKLLIPYNVMVPFVGILSSFLHPLKNALLIDSARPYHFIPLQLGVFNFLLSLFILTLFIKKFVFKYKQLSVLAIFYMFNIIYLYLWNPVTSRYFIYLSPLFCIIFCAVCDYLYTSLTKQFKIKIITKDIVLVLIFVSICIPNLLAIKQALFRGRMANTYLTYDYARAADAVKYDLIKRNRFEEIKKKRIYINNIVPISFTSSKDFPASDLHNDNVRFVFFQIFNDVSINIIPNQIPKKDENHIAYSLDGYWLYNSEGVNTSLFSQFFEEALELLRQSRYMEATDLFRKAIEERPYLLNYVLSNLKLEDLEWVTNGRDMRTWINNIRSFFSEYRDSYALEKAKYILTIMNREIDEYIQCHFYISFLKYASGYTEESKYWFSRIRFLENNYQRLFSWLAQVQYIRSEKRILSYLDSFDNASLYVEPDNYRDRHKYEKFLFRLIFNTL